MEALDAVELLHALAHPGRLAVVRLLIKAGSDGLPAGQVAVSLDTPPNSMSAQLSILTRAGLILAERRGRSIIYTASYDRMSALLAFLVEDCCAGSARICGPLASMIDIDATSAKPPPTGREAPVT